MAIKFSVFSNLKMVSNSSRIYNRTWGYGHSDPMSFAREFRIRRDQANMERALTDLSYIFVRIFLWATIYAVTSENSKVTIKWVTEYCKQRKRTSRDRKAPEAARPPTNIPELQQMGPTMI